MAECAWKEVDVNTALTLLQNIYTAMLSLQVEFQHWHREHEHMKSHECSDISLTCGGTFIPWDNIPPLATILSMEYMCNEDRDGNGLIYGYDFDFLDDGTKPITLQSLNQMPTWTTPVQYISWADYVAWARGTGDNPLS